MERCPHCSFNPTSRSDFCDEHMPYTHAELQVAVDRMAFRAKDQQSINLFGQSEFPAGAVAHGAVDQRHAQPGNGQMTTDAERLAWIAQATLEELLRKWRFSPPGDLLLQGEVGAVFSKTMFAMRDADPAAWTAASKAIGW